MTMERDRLTLMLTKPYLDALAHLVAEGVYAERQVAIRDALRTLFRSHNIPPFQREAEN